MGMKTILVVDDEQDLREILRFNLTSSGYWIETAGSAEEAMGKLTGVDLILLDVMMDGMSGFEMTERLKKNPQTAAIPVIFLTAKDTERDLLHGFQLGADDYISKPFSLKEVKARVKAVAQPHGTADTNNGQESLIRGIGRGRKDKSRDDRREDHSPHTDRTTTAHAVLDGAGNGVFARGIAATRVAKRCNRNRQDG